MADLQKSSVSLQLGVQVRNMLVAAYQRYYEYAACDENFMHKIKCSTAYPMAYFTLLVFIYYSLVF